MCKSQFSNVDSPVGVSIPKSDVGPTDVSEPETPQIVTCHFFIGDWVDSMGNSVVVFLVDSASPAKIRATLSKPGRRDFHLSLSQSHNGEWQCGDAVIASRSDHEVRWRFSTKRVSTWKRVQADSDTSSASNKVLLPEVALCSNEKVVSISAASALCELDGCQSPTERWFNPVRSGGELVLCPNLWRTEIGPSFAALQRLRFQLGHSLQPQPPMVIGRNACSFF